MVLRSVTIDQKDAQILTQTTDDVYLGYSVNNDVAGSSSSSSDNPNGDGLCQFSSTSTGGSPFIMWKRATPNQKINAQVAFGKVNQVPSISFIMEGG